MKFLAVGILLPLFIAQTPSPNGSTGIDWVTVVGTYGVAAPLVLYLIIDNRRKDGKIDRLETRNQSLTDAAVDKIVPLTVEATSLLREAGMELKTLTADRERVLQLLTQATSQFDGDTLKRILRMLERIERSSGGT